jgi:hypothetical protein
MDFVFKEDVVLALPIPENRVLMRLTDDVNGLTLVGVWVPTKYVVPITPVIEEKENA